MVSLIHSSFKNFMNSNRQFLERFALLVTTLGGLSYIAMPFNNRQQIDSLNGRLDQLNRSLKLSEQKTNHQLDKVITRFDLMEQRARDERRQVTTRLDLMEQRARDESNKVTARVDLMDREAQLWRAQVRQQFNALNAQLKTVVESLNEKSSATD
ncbi:hypothetical protein MP228_006015 [Amoeboaphelidium protococcarum]|nr:hypothetical protein MP228_006015 [Amoeboaphelidium protococcarum]